MENLLKEILSEIKTIKTDINDIKQGQAKSEAGLKLNWKMGRSGLKRN